MSLGLNWFSKSAVEERRKQYPTFSSDEWSDVLFTYFTSIWPVATEAAEWLKENLSATLIYERFGYSILHLYAEVGRDAEAKALADSIRESAKSSLLKARDEALATGVEDPDIEDLRTKLREATQQEISAQTALSTQLEIQDKREANSQSAQLKKDVKASAKLAIREIELRCRWVIGGFFIGAVGAALAIALWLGSFSYAAPVAFEAVIVTKVILAAVILPLPLGMFCLWVEGKLSKKYVYQAAMGEYPRN